jgi:nuclear pore complex protein Nup98-Nup96
LREQLDVWREQRIDVHIGEQIRKLYALLAGIVDTLEGSTGPGSEKCSDVVIHKDLDWKRVYGLHLWFSEPPEAPLAAVFQAYDNFWKTTSSTAPPIPPHPPSLWNPSRTKPPPPDALFSLIRLHAETTCSLSQILDPLSFTASPLDYSIPWHLYILLSRCMRVRDFSDRGESNVGKDVDMESRGSVADDVQANGHSPTADLLASSYACQLERHGMIQEAAFVLLHIEGSYGYVIRAAVVLPHRVLRLF